MTRIRLALAAAFTANVGIALAKLVGFAITGSASLLAESLHSLADTSNQVLLQVGRVRARRRESPEHPFGYGAERFFWAFLVSIFLFVGGALLSVYQGVQRVLAPEPVEHVGLGLVILVVALALDGTSLLVAARSAGRRPGEGWLQYIRRTKTPEVPVLLLEDTTSITGVLVAMSALTLSAITGNTLWDGVGSIVIGLLLGTMALLLARETQSLLIGEAASPQTRAKVDDAILRDEAVRSLVYVRTLHVGPDELFVEAKVVMDPEMTVRQVAPAIDRIEARIRALVPKARIISIEPDIPRPDDPDRPRYEGDY